MADDHGKTPAAWTAMTVMLVGCTVSAVAIVVATPWLFFVGLAVVVLGVVVGKVMQMMGMGQTVTYKDERQPDYGKT